MQAYSNNLVDHHIILDLLPSLAQAYFSHHIPANLSYLQAAILLSLGLQQNDISSLESAIQLPPNQALALFNKVMLLATSHTRIQLMWDIDVAYTYSCLQGTSAEEFDVHTSYALSHASLAKSACSLCCTAEELSNSLLRTNCRWFVMRKALAAWPPDHSHSSSWSCTVSYGKAGLHHYELSDCECV